MPWEKKEFAQLGDTIECSIIRCNTSVTILNISSTQAFQTSLKSSIGTCE